jgi:O-antigen/teichoic acid export membrane protein
VRTTGYGRGAAILSVGIGATGLITFGYFSLASHALPEAEYGRVALLWSAIFITVSVLYRPVEQMLSRTIADREARGVSGNEHLRVAVTIQLALGALFLVTALLLRDPLQDDLLGGSAALFWILIVSVLAYAASYFARGFLAGHRRFGLYGGLVLMESTSRCLFALAVAVGIAEGETAVALGMVAAPIVSLAVVPPALARRLAPATPSADASAAPSVDAPAADLDEDPGGRPNRSAEPALRGEASAPRGAPSRSARAGSPPGSSGGAALRDDAPSVAARRSSGERVLPDDGPRIAGSGSSGEPDFTLARGAGFALAVLAIMLAEQTFLNAGPLLVQATESERGAALAGFAFNVLLIARAPLVLFQAVQTSILPHLTGLWVSREGEASTDPFRRSVNVTLAAIAGFAACVALLMLAAGPLLMDLLFGGDFDYERGGLALVALGMGLWLGAGTLGQALLAQGRARVPALFWLLAAGGFVVFLLVSPIDDPVLAVEVALFGSTAFLFASLLSVYRRA